MLSLEILCTIMMANRHNLSDFIEMVVKLSLVNKSLANSVSIQMKDFNFCKKLLERYLERNRSVPDWLYNFGSKYFTVKDCYFERMRRITMESNSYEKESLVKFTRQCLILKYSPFCSICHQNFGDSSFPKDILRTFWMLGMTICNMCCKNSFISSRKLYSMGLRLDMEIPGSTNKSTKYLLEYLVGEVYSIRIQNRSGFEKEYFSRDHQDGTCFLNYSKYGYIYFWKRDLEKVLDMKYVESQFKEKKRAGALIFAFVKRLHVQDIIKKTMGLKTRDEMSLVKADFCTMSLKDKTMFLYKADKFLLFDVCRDTKLHRTAKIDMGSIIHSRNYRWKKRMDHLMREYHNVGHKCRPGKHAIERMKRECYDILCNLEKSFSVFTFQEAFDKEMKKKIEEYHRTTFAIC